VEDIIIQKPVWPAVVYHIVSIIFFFILYYGKLKVTHKRKRFLFILYTLFVIFVASVQFGLFAHGTEFSNSFLHINLDVDSYDSVYWGALFYSLLYLIATPKNIFVKYV